MHHVPVQDRPDPSGPRRPPAGPGFRYALPDDGGWPVVTWVDPDGPAGTAGGAAS